MLSPSLANYLTGPVTFVSRHLPDLGTKVIVHLHRPLIGHQLLLIEHDGFKIFVDPNDNCGGRLYYWGSYEPEQTAVFKQLLDELRPSTFIDIGANIGYYSLLAAAHSEASIYAFEPSPRIADSLARSVSVNTFKDRIHPVRKAASKEKGTLAFFVNENPHNFGLGSIVQTVDASTRVTVECCAPDDELTTDLGPSVLCKVDVEGAEYSALQGMQRILTTSHPTLIVEVHPVELKEAGSSSEQVCDLLRSFGYKLSTLDNSGEITDYAALPDDDNYWVLGRWVGSR
jgi:FkbM family methyltransferase